jgi:predicted RNA-binding protein (virulence factor B family)
VFLFLDTATDRIAASTRLEQHLSLLGADFQPRQAVDLLIYGKSDLGFKAVINGTHLGQLYANETFQPLHYGESVKGFIRRLRADGKIDLTLQLPAHQGSHQLDEAIIQYLQQNQGVSTLTDKSPPDEIYRMYGVSKTNYKKALGHLYRQRRIVIEKHRISLAP